ncbi:MAG: hypothetical protein ACN6O7_05870, partial [Sphingobacterium sp.]
PKLASPEDQVVNLPRNRMVSLSEIYIKDRWKLDCTICNLTNSLSNSEKGPKLPCLEGML